MSENPTYDDVMRDIANLTELVKEHADDRATLDYDKLAAAVVAQQAALVDESPVRRGEEIAAGDLIAPRTGKYRGVDPVDLQMAHVVLEGAARFKPSLAPSDQLVEAVAAIDAEEKALTATGSGTGDEYVPTGMEASLWEDFHMSSLIGGNLTPVPMPTNPFDLPVEWGAGTWTKGSEGEDPGADDLATSKKTLTATEQILEVVWGYDLDEDAVVAVMPSLRASLGRQGGEQIDEFIVNADATATATGNVNLDDDTPPDNAWYLSNGEDGIRHQFIVDNSGQAVAAGGDALTEADMTGMMALLGKYMLDGGNSIISPDAKSYVNMMALDAVQTIDKFGAGASILTGELAKYAGMPVVPSGAVPLTMADGKMSTTAASNTLGQIAAWNRNSWALGFRRALMIEVDRNIRTRQFIMVVSFRIAVAAFGTRSAATHTAGIINILV